MSLKLTDRQKLFLWVLWVAAFSILSGLMPRDASFDVAHYHIHNGWSALNGRLDIDLAPAEMHSFLNPAYNVMVYWLMTKLPGVLVAAIVSIPHALVLPALYALIRATARAMGAHISAPIALIAAGTGLIAAPSALLMASVRNDVWGALVFIFALCLILPKENRPPSLLRLAYASLAMGLITGLKLTNAVYVIGFAGGVMIAIPGLWARIKTGLVCAGAGLGGILLTGGPWALVLWKAFGNPVFPMMNGVFGSPQGPDASFRDERYLPDNVVDALLYPFKFLFDGTLINEDNFIDVRFQLAYIGIFFIFAAGFLAWRKKRPVNLRGPLSLAGALFVLIMVWLQMFAIQRYALAVWFLGPVFLSLSVLIWKPSWLDGRKGIYGALVCALAITLTTQTPPLRRAEWQSLAEPYAWSEVPADIQTENSLVVFVGGHPNAFNTIGFPESARFTHALPQLWSRPALDKYRPLITSMIDKHDGPIWIVTFDLEGRDAAYREVLIADHKLDFVADACRDLTTSFDVGPQRWRICPGVKSPSF